MIKKIILIIKNIKLYFNNIDKYIQLMNILDNIPDKNNIEYILKLFDINKSFIYTEEYRYEDNIKYINKIKEIEELLFSIKNRSYKLITSGKDIDDIISLNKNLLLELITYYISYTNPFFIFNNIKVENDIVSFTLEGIISSNILYPSLDNIKKELNQENNIFDFNINYSYINNRFIFNIQLNRNTNYHYTILKLIELLNLNIKNYINILMKDNLYGLEYNRLYSVSFLLYLKEYIKFNHKELLSEDMIKDCNTIINIIDINIKFTENIISLINNEYLQ